MDNAQLINQTSGNTEYYTPMFIIDAVKRLLGHIDLDPASCIKVNNYIQAKNIYTKEDNGLNKKWFGKVWLNHPFSKKENELWVNKLTESYYDYDIDEALCITYYCSSERWFTPLLSFPRCILIPRTNYLWENNETYNSTKGSVITYLGDNIVRFNDIFETLGSIDIPYYLAKGLNNVDR